MDAMNEDGRLATYDDNDDEMEGDIDEEQLDDGMDVVEELKIGPCTHTA